MGSSSDPPSANIIGGRFLIERRLGAGGMGMVCRAQDLETGQMVAVKLAAKHHDASDWARRSFDREAELLGSLKDHSRFQKLITHGTQPDGTPFLVTELLDGEDLSWRLAQGPLSIGESLAVAWGAAEAIAELHAHGIVHGDIKPGNLFLCGGDVGRVKLLDLGMAIRSEDAGQTDDGPPQVVGTPLYMAPEQIRGKVHPASDVYSLGCVLFEALTGRPPFEGRRLMVLLAKRLNQDAPLASEHRPDIPIALDDLVARMLARDPEARPDDTALLSELGRAARLAHTDRRGGATPMSSGFVEPMQRPITLASFTPEDTADEALLVAPRMMRRAAISSPIAFYLGGIADEDTLDVAPPPAEAAYLNAWLDGAPDNTLRLGEARTLLLTVGDLLERSLLPREAAEIRGPPPLSERVALQFVVHCPGCSVRAARRSYVYRTAEPAAFELHARRGATGPRDAVITVLREQAVLHVARLTLEILPEHATPREAAP